MTDSPARELSVIVGAAEGQPDPTPCLMALSGQVRGRAVEVIFVANAGHRSVNVARRFPFVSVVESERPRLVPELWGLGVTRATGAVVAITMSGCVPAPDWVDRLIELHRATTEGQPVAIGGAIEQAEPAGLVDWALYFVRYAPYMRPFSAGTVTDVPGDNGSYRRAALDPDLAYIAEHGFWETEINRRLRARGQTLRRDPSVLVWHTHSYDLRGFSRQRFRHGVLFGAERRRALGSSAALVRAALAPVSLAAMVMRSSRHVLTKRRHRAAMLKALPVTVWFYGCWVAGEAIGLVGAKR